MNQIEVVNARGSFIANVYTLDDFTEAFNIGDLEKGALVAEEVIDQLRNNLPPVIDWGYLFQSGGSVHDRITEDGIRHPAYLTFMTNPGVLPYWEYRGTCLKGEQSERGEIPPWQVLKPSSH